MTTPWAHWDQLVSATGRPERVAADLTDEELVALLALDVDGRRDDEKNVLKDEALARMQGRVRTGSAPVTQASRPPSR